MQERPRQYCYTVMIYFVCIHIIFIKYVIKCITITCTLLKHHLMRRIKATTDKDKIGI